MERAEAVLRAATVDDQSASQALMHESAAALFPRFYDERQSASAVRYVAQADPMLLADGTYFVLESGGETVGCGGWSRRDKLYTGSGDADGDARALDPATEPARVRAMFVRADWTRRGLGRRILEADRLLTSALCYARMLIARAATRRTVIAESAASDAISAFALRVSGMTSVGLNANEFVSET